MSENLREQVQVNVSIIVEHLPNGTYLSYPEYAEHIRFTSEDREEAIAQVIRETAYTFEI